MEQGAQAWRKSQRHIAFPGLLKVYENNAFMRKTIRSEARNGQGTRF